MNKIRFTNRLLGEELREEFHKPLEEITKVLEVLGPVMKEAEESWKEAKKTVRQFASELYMGGFISQCGNVFQCLFCNAEVTKSNIKEHFKQIPPACAEEIAKKACQKALFDKIFFDESERKGESAVFIGKRVYLTLKYVLKQLYSKEKVILIPARKGRAIAALISKYEKINIEDQNHRVVISLAQ